MTGKYEIPVKAVSNKHGAGPALGQRVTVAAHVMIAENTLVGVEHVIASFINNSLDTDFGWFTKRLGNMDKAEGPPGNMRHESMLV